MRKASFRQDHARSQLMCMDAMPRKISLSRELKLLEERRSELKAQLKDLNTEQRSLLLRQSLLHAWCDSLSHMQIATASKSAGERDCPHYAELLQKECTLLQQLTTNNGEVYTSLYAADVLHPGTTTIAPVADPMAYFKHHVSRPPLPQAATMTAEQMAKILREATLQCSVRLHALQGAPAEEQGPMLEQLQDMWDKCMHSAMSLIMFGREHIVETMNIINLDTLQPDPAGSAAVAAQMGSIASRLQLTPQQQHIIATGSALYVRMLEGIMEERQQLQLGFANAADTSAACMDCGAQSAAAAAGATAAAAAGATAAAAAGATADSFTSRHAQLEAEQQRMARLQLLMQKEYILRMAGMAWIVGCLSWPQVTQAAVLSWPFPLRMSLLAKEITKQWYWEQQQRQQQQRQQREEQPKPQQQDAAGTAAQQLQSTEVTNTGQASDNPAASSES